MYILRIKDRGRDLAVHTLEERNEAHELARIYELLGFPSEKIVIEREERAAVKAA